MIMTKYEVEQLIQCINAVDDISIPISTAYLKALLTSWLELDDENNKLRQLLRQQEQDKYRILIETAPKVYESQIISLDEIVREELLRYILNKNNSQ